MILEPGFAAMQPCNFADRGAKPMLLAQFGGGF